MDIGSKSYIYHEKLLLPQLLICFLLPNWNVPLEFHFHGSRYQFWRTESKMVFYQLVRAESGNIQSHRWVAQTLNLVPGRHYLKPVTVSKVIKWRNMTLNLIRHISLDPVSLWAFFEPFALFVYAIFQSEDIFTIWVASQVPYASTFDIALIWCTLGFICPFIFFVILSVICHYS